jgi:hypothetical protein
VAGLRRDFRRHLTLSLGRSPASRERYLCRSRA